MRLAILLLAATAVSAQNWTDIQFSVVRAKADTLEQLQVIRSIYDQAVEHHLDFWLTPSGIGHKADIMVPEGELGWLVERLQTVNTTYMVTIPDVGKLIKEREHKPKKNKTSFSKRLLNENGNRARYGFGDYHSYDTIVEWMRDIERKYPDRAKVIRIGTTHENRGIFAIKLGKNIERTDKRVFWIDGGIHAREWAAVHTVLYFIDRLIADYDDDQLVRTAGDHVHFYIVPVLNPDGYEYSRSDPSPMVRLWRKNRSGVVCKKDRWFRNRCCGGVDLNRNFDWFFGETGSSTDKCSEVYQGTDAFSEAEARAVRDMILGPALKGKVDGFMTIHTYSQMWIHPFSHQRKTVSEDIKDIERVGREAVSALEATYGTKYKFGTGADILYPSAGGSDDWAKGKGGAKYAYLLELRPGEEVWDGFILDQRQLMPTAKETWNGLKVVIRAVNERAVREPPEFVAIAPPLAPPTAPPTTTPTPTPSTTITPTTILTKRPNKFLTTPSVELLPFFYILGKKKYQFVEIKKFVHPLHHEVATIATNLTTPFYPPRTTTTTNPQLIEESDEEFEGTSTTTSLETTPLRRPTRPRRPRPLSHNRTSISKSKTSAIVDRLRAQQAALENATRQQQQQQTTNSDPVVQPSRNEASSIRRPVATPPPSTSSTCADRSPWCQAWRSASPNVCTISSVYMRRDCARTCGYCRLP